MEQIKGNKLGFKTFKYLKVNETEINIPDIDIKEYFAGFTLDEIVEAIVE